MLYPSGGEYGDGYGAGKFRGYNPYETEPTMVLERQVPDGDPTSPAWFLAPPGTNLELVDNIAGAIQTAQSNGDFSGLTSMDDANFLIGMMRTTEVSQNPVTYTMNDNHAPWKSDEQAATYAKWVGAGTGWYYGGNGSKVAMLGPNYPTSGGLGPKLLNVPVPTPDPNDLANIVVAGNTNSHWNGTYTVDGNWQWNGTAFEATPIYGNLIFREVDSSGNVKLIYYNSAQGEWDISRVNQADAAAYVPGVEYDTLPGRGGHWGDLSDGAGVTIPSWGIAPGSPNDGGTITRNAGTIIQPKYRGAVFYRYAREKAYVSPNWTDPEQYELKIDLANNGMMDVYKYGADPAENPKTYPNTNWTITGWGNTVLRGNAEYSADSNTTRLYLHTNNEGFGQYYPFVASSFAPPANAQESFTGESLNCDVLYYEFDGHYWELMPGANLRVHYHDGNVAPTFQSPDIENLHDAVQSSVAQLQDLNNGLADGNTTDEGDEDQDADSTEMEDVGDPGTVTRRVFDDVYSLGPTRDNYTNWDSDDPAKPFLGPTYGLYGLDQADWTIELEVQQLVNCPEPCFL